MDSREDKKPTNCEDIGFEHLWEDDPNYIQWPGTVQRRICVNCGKRQKHKPGEWVDIEVDIEDEEDN